MAEPYEPVAFTPSERDCIRSQLTMFVSTLPTVAEGFPLRTWAGGPQRGQPKVPQVAAGLVARGLLRLDAAARWPRLFFTDAGLAALRAMMADTRLADPARFAHVRQELGIGPGRVQGQSVAVGGPPPVVDAFPVLGRCFHPGRDGVTGCPPYLEDILMARTPKAVPASSFNPLPSGRRPKGAAAATLAQAAASDTTETEDATLSTAPALVADSAPARGRAGRKPKARDVAATPSLTEQALEQQPEPDANQPAAVGGDALIAEMAYPVTAGEGSGASEGDAALTVLAQETPAQGTPSTAKPAAQWDRATDEVRFDWPEIERTALQGGPNQTMARLLVAARAEGANSRWPL